jgi:dephospho-CoA kinase
MILGVTGLIGSGKSTVARAFRDEGALLIDCDRIGREVVESDSTIQYQLVLAFGGSILTRRKTIDRRRLGRLAFSSAENTEKLNSIVHPALLAELDRRVRDARARGETAVIDAALLIYWNYHTKVDYTILVTAYTRNRMNRLRATGLTDDEIRQRTRSQLPLSHLRERSDFVLANNTNPEKLRTRAIMLYRRLADGEMG